MQKWLTALGFLTLLLGIAFADALFTRSSILLPEFSGEHGPVRKETDPDIAAVLESKGYLSTGAREESLIVSIAPDGNAVHTSVLLDGNDRLAFFAWMESDDARRVFIALKEALHVSFSPALTGLRDEVQAKGGHPQRSVLSFRDPAIHEEQLTVVRMRNRLYEFHIPAGKEAEVEMLIDALTE